MNATPNFPQIPALPTSFHREEWKESAQRDLILIMNHLIKASKFVPDVTISLKQFETKLFVFFFFFWGGGFCHRSHLQLHHQAFLFSLQVHCRVQKHTVRKQLLSVISHIMMVPSFSIHGNKLLFITTSLLKHINLLHNNVRMRDGHLSGVFHIYSHIFNFLFDFAKWQQPHQIEPLLTAWCFCYGVVLNTAWME